MLLLLLRIGASQSVNQPMQTLNCSRSRLVATLLTRSPWLTGLLSWHAHSLLRLLLHVEPRLLLLLLLLPLLLLLLLVPSLHHVRLLLLQHHGGVAARGHNVAHDLRVALAKGLLALSLFLDLFHSL